jgi:hypothetical protein
MTGMRNQGALMICAASNVAAVLIECLASP